METPVVPPPTTFYRVSLKAVIRDDSGKILAVKDNGSNWTLPGGGWDHGESEHDALARELYEEVGFVGDFASRIFATQTFWLDHRRSWLLWLVYDVTIKDFDPQLFSCGADADEITWLYPSEFKTIQTEGGRWIYQHLAK